MSVGVNADRGSLADVVADAVGHIPPDVEIPILHGRKVTVVVYAGLDAFLHGFANRPVLPIDKIPEVHGVPRIEVRLVDLLRFEEEMANDLGAFGPERLQH